MSEAPLALGALSVAEWALELAARRAQAAEAIFSRGDSVPVSFENDKLKTIESSHSASVSLRVICDGKVGLASTTDLTDVPALVEQAAQAAEFGPDATFEFPGSGPEPEVKVFDPTIVDLSTQELVRLGQEMLDMLKAYNPEILVDSGASKGVGEGALANTSGLRVQRRRTHFSLGVGGQLVRGTDMLQAFDHRGRLNRELDHQRIAANAIEKFRLAETNASLKSGEMPVIFTPTGVGGLIYPLMLGFNGKNVLKGESPLRGRLGEQAFHPSLTITDNALVHFAPGSSPRDGEGVPSQVTPLIEKGVIRSFLYDLETAGKAGVRSTGNGRGCDATNLIIAPGQASYEEMIAGVQDGVLVDYMMGLGQSNIINGDISVNIALGYRIENGEIVGRVKDAMLSGNVYEALKNVAAIGDTPEWVGYAYTAPILIGAMSVVAKGEGGSE